LEINLEQLENISDTDELAEGLDKRPNANSIGKKLTQRRVGVKVDKYFRLNKRFSSFKRTNHLKSERNKKKRQKMTLTADEVRSLVCEALAGTMNNSSKKI